VEGVLVRKGGAVFSDGGPLSRRRGTVTLRVLTTGEVTITRRGIFGFALPREIVFRTGLVDVERRPGGFIRFTGGPLRDGQRIDFQTFRPRRMARELNSRGIAVRNARPT